MFLHLWDGESVPVRSVSLCFHSLVVRYLQQFPMYLAFDLLRMMVSFLMCPLFGSRKIG